MEVTFNKHNRRLRLGITLAGALALGTPLLFGAGCGDRADVYMDQARRYEQTYEYDKAARNYELVTLSFKHNRYAAEAAAGRDRCISAVHLDRAEELIFDNAVYTALEELAAARRLDGDNPRLFYLGGLAHVQIGPEEVALQEFDACIRRWPESPYGYLGRGEYFRRREEREAAFAEYTRAFRTAGADVKTRAAAFRGLRDMAKKLGQADAALAPYGREASAVFASSAFQYWLGYYYIRKKPMIYTDAATYFVDALESHPNRLYGARAKAGLAECRAHDRDFPAAKKLIDEAIAADPENDYFFKVAAGVYPRLGLPAPVKSPK